MSTDEMEKYKKKDRQEEAGACIMGEMRKDREKFTEGDEQDDPTLWEIAKELKVTYADAVPIQEDRRLKKEAKIEAAKIKKDVTEMDKLKKRAQEAEGELSIMKQLETNRVKEAQARSAQLQDELDRMGKENNNLYNRMADALEVNESHQKLNGKLQERLTELEQENIELHANNKKLSRQIEDRIDKMRKAGM